MFYKPTAVSVDVVHCFRQLGDGNEIFSALPRTPVVPKYRNYGNQIGILNSSNFVVYLESGFQHIIKRTMNFESNYDLHLTNLTETITSIRLILDLLSEV